MTVIVDMDIVATSPETTEAGCPHQRAALAAFSSYALGDPDLDDLLDEATRIIAETMRVSFCRIMQYRTDEDDLFLRAGAGWPPGMVGRLKVPADLSNPVGRTFLSGEPLITADTRALPEPKLAPFFRKHGILASACVPIDGSGGAFGTLGVDSAEARTFTDDDVAFLTGFAGVIAEAVSRIRRKRALRRTLQEKEAQAHERGVLLREMQHRVRNHLQLIQSSLNIQIRRTTEPKARKGFREVAGQVLALSTLYDHLLGVGMGKTIDFTAYLSSLCNSIGSLGTLNGGQIGGRIDLTYHADGQIVLELDRSTSLGLVTHELIANALEHAFADGKGKIEVSLRAAGPGEALLTIADNGKGFSSQASHGTGMRLVERLVKQVDGSLEATTGSGTGTAWKITFPV